MTLIALFYSFITELNHVNKRTVIEDAECEFNVCWRKFDDIEKLSQQRLFTSRAKFSNCSFLDLVIAFKFTRVLCPKDAKIRGELD